MPEEEAERPADDRVERSIAVESTYVHQVYDVIAKDLVHAVDPLESRVEEFLNNLDPGSLVADIGCGDGRHLLANNRVYSVGLDQSFVQSVLTRKDNKESLVGDNLSLPFKTESFDAVTSVAVIHHLATTGRRVKALRELARVLRVGGKILITVRALDQNSKFESQDLLIPWYQSSQSKIINGGQEWPHQVKKIKKNGDDDEIEIDDEGDDDEEDSISIPSSDEEDALLSLNHVHAMYSGNMAFRKETLVTSRNNDHPCHSLDTTPMGDHSSGLEESCPDQSVFRDSCYGFVRKAFRRLSSNNSSSSSSHSGGNQSYRLENSNDDSALPPSPANLSRELFTYNDHCCLATELSDHIELRNLDEDCDSTFRLSPSYNPWKNRNPTRQGSVDCLQSKESLGTKKKLVRSFSDFFKKSIPRMWGIRDSWNDSYRNLPNQFSAAGAVEDTTYSRTSATNSIVRSKTTATCTFKFESFPRLESVDELEAISDFNPSLVLPNKLPATEFGFHPVSNALVKADITSLTSSDIENGNELMYGEEISSHHSPSVPPSSQTSCGVPTPKFYHPGFAKPKYNVYPDDNRISTTAFLDQKLLEFMQVSHPDLSPTFVESAVPGNDLYDRNEKQEQEGLFKTPKLSTIEDDVERMFGQLMSLKLDDKAPSPKRYRRRNGEDDVWHMISSKTTGPFYDTDESFEDENVILSSYYSMPELYKLSDYHQQYDVFTCVKSGGLQTGSIIAELCENGHKDIDNGNLRPCRSRGEEFICGNKPLNGMSACVINSVFDSLSNLEGSTLDRSICSNWETGGTIYSESCQFSEAHSEDFGDRNSGTVINDQQIISSDAQNNEIISICGEVRPDNESSDMTPLRKPSSSVIPISSPCNENMSNTWSNSNVSLSGNDICTGAKYNPFSSSPCANLAILDRSCDASLSNFKELSSDIARSHEVIPPLIEMPNICGAVFTGKEETRCFESQRSAFKSTSESNSTVRSKNSKNSKPYYKSVNSEIFADSEAVDENVSEDNSEGGDVTDRQDIWSHKWHNLLRREGQDSRIQRELFDCKELNDLCNLSAQCHDLKQEAVCFESRQPKRGQDEIDRNPNSCSDFLESLAGEKRDPKSKPREPFVEDIYHFAKLNDGLDILRDFECQDLEAECENHIQIRDKDTRSFLRHQNAGSPKTFSLKTSAQHTMFQSNRVKELDDTSVNKFKEPVFARHPGYSCSTQALEIDIYHPEEDKNQINIFRQNLVSDRSIPPRRDGGDRLDPKEHSENLGNFEISSSSLSSDLPPHKLVHPVERNCLSGDLSGKIFSKSSRCVQNSGESPTRVKEKTIGCSEPHERDTNMSYAPKLDISDLRSSNLNTCRKPDRDTKQLGTYGELEWLGPVVHKDSHSHDSFQSPPNGPLRLVSKEGGSVSDQRQSVDSGDDVKTTELCPTKREHFHSPPDPKSSRDVDPIHGHVNGDDVTIALHRYYHVFKEGEIEQLIENFVEDLHILSSYYCSSSWCVVAEKVRVWTI